MTGDQFQYPWGRDWKQGQGLHDRMPRPRGRAQYSKRKFRPGVLRVLNRAISGRPLPEQPPEQLTLF